MANDHQTNGKKGTQLTAEWLPVHARPSWMPEDDLAETIPMFGMGDYWFQAIGASSDGRFVPVPRGHAIRMIDLWGTPRIGPIYQLVPVDRMIIRVEFLTNSLLPAGQGLRWERELRGVWNHSDGITPAMVLAGDLLVMLVYDPDDNLIRVQVLNALTGDFYGGDPTKPVPRPAQGA